MLARVFWPPFTCVENSREIATSAIKKPRIKMRGFLKILHEFKEVQ